LNTGAILQSRRGSFRNPVLRPLPRVVANRRVMPYKRWDDGVRATPRGTRPAASPPAACSGRAPTRRGACRRGVSPRPPSAPVPLSTEPTQRRMRVLRPPCETRLGRSLGTRRLPARTRYSSVCAQAESARCRSGHRRRRDRWSRVGLDLPDPHAERTGMAVRPTPGGAGPTALLLPSLDGPRRCPDRTYRRRSRCSGPTTEWERRAVVGPGLKLSST
jgi:hypothetical protein